MFLELSALDPEVIQQLSELDVESLKKLENISNSLNGTGGGIDPSLIALLAGGNGNPSQSSGGSTVDGDDPIPVDPKLIKQLVANGQISQEVADMLINSGSNSGTGLSRIDPRILKALQKNPELIKQLQGPDGKIDPNLIKEFTENGGELSDDQLRVLETGTLPPELADVPPNILRETGFFDGLPRGIQIQLGVIDPDEEFKSSTVNENKKKNEKLQERNPNKPSKSNTPKKSRLAAIKLGIVKRVNRTRTLPPKLRKVPKPVLKETGLFDSLPKDLQEELGLLDPKDSLKLSEKEKNRRKQIKTTPSRSSQVRRRIDESSFHATQAPARKNAIRNIFLDKLNPQRILHSARSAARNTKSAVSKILYSQYNRIRRIGIRSYSGIRRIFKPKTRRKGIFSFLNLDNFKLPPLFEITSPNKYKRTEKGVAGVSRNSHRKWRSNRSGTESESSLLKRINSYTSGHHLNRRQVDNLIETRVPENVNRLNVVIKENANDYEKVRDNSSSDEEDLRAISLEPIFKEIELLDSKYDCGKLYVCELGVGGTSVSKDELVLMSLLAGKNGISIASSKSPFDMAVLLGRVTKSIESCRERYNRCDIASSHYKNHPFSTQ